MFHSITLLKREVIADNKLRIVLSIKDTCFSQEIELIGPNLYSAYYEPVGILKTYIDRSLNAVRNLAIYYLTIPEGNKCLTTDAYIIEEHFPTFNYRQKFSKVVKIYYDDFKQLINEYNEERDWITYWGSKESANGIQS